MRPATVVAILLAAGLLAPPGALSAARPSGTYAGTTSQDNPVVIQLSRDRKRVTRLAIHWDAKCQSGDQLPLGFVVDTSARPTPEPVSEKPYVPVAKNGRFKGTAARVRPLSGGARVGTLIQDFAGKVGKASAAGTWSAVLAVVDVQTGQKVDECSTGAVRWTAPKPQNLYYGGTTSKGEPVVVQLSRNRRSVGAFRIGWSADCTPDGFFSIGDALANFRLSRSGGFKDTFPQTYTRPDGSKNKFDYELAGRVGRSKASGTFHARVTDIASAGTTTSTCDSPRLTWTAKQ
jgi:hypothetical protein